MLYQLLRLRSHCAVCLWKLSESEVMPPKGNKMALLWESLLTISGTNSVTNDYVIESSVEFLLGRWV